MSEKNYSTSITPSSVWLPEESQYSTVLDFMIGKFPRIAKEIWVQRFEEGKVLDREGIKLTLKSLYRGGQHITYFREVPKELIIPFQEEILYQNDNLLIVDKPHFLPVHPSGKYVNETLLNRLKIKTGLKDLVVAHRLDRLTAGLLLCIKNKDARGTYQEMFIEGRIKKTYVAVGVKPEGKQKEWHVKNHLEKVNPRFLMRVGEGMTNSESYIKILKEKEGKALFELKPVTGKKHQLRVHLASIGSGIENDPLYPEVKEDRTDDYSKPMKLLAQELEFTDPLTGNELKFKSRRSLDF